jgi:hypothetical protein
MTTIGNPLPRCSTSIGIPPASILIIGGLLSQSLLQYFFVD